MLLVELVQKGQKVTRLLAKASLVTILSFFISIPTLDAEQVNSDKRSKWHSKGHAPGPAATPGLGYIFQGLNRTSKCSHRQE